MRGQRVFECPLKSLDYTVALLVVGRRSCLLDPKRRHKSLKEFRLELSPLIGGDDVGYPIMRYPVLSSVFRHVFQGSRFGPVGESVDDGE